VIRALLFSLVLTTASTGAEHVPLSGAEAVVIFNPNQPESEALARYYAEKRGVPATQVLAVPCVTTETIKRDVFDSTVADPIRKAFLDNGWFTVGSGDVLNTATGKTESSPIVTAAKIRVLVLMHGIPTKVERIKQQDAKPSQEDEASVDSELAALGLPFFTLNGGTPNPFFDKATRFRDTPSALGMLIVGRLDASNPATVRRMIDDALAVENSGLCGRGVIDLALKPGPYQIGDDWLRSTSLTWKASGIATYVDRSEALVRAGWPLPDTALYFGWYAGDVQGAFLTPDFRFKRGAVACHLHSFSAGILRSTTQGWVGPLLDRGAAATMGNVWEPYLAYTVHFDVFNDRLLKGWSFGEAAWCGLPTVSWMNIAVGDPLYRPFATGSTGEGDDRDYALFRGFVDRHDEDKDSRDLKKDVLRFAQNRSNGRLLELLALYCGQEGKTSEELTMLEAAQSLAEQPSDKLRLTIYRAELLLRDGSKEAVALARALLNAAATDAQMKSLTAQSAVATLLRDAGVAKEGAPTPALEVKPPAK
jgi:uncharacterized protein (TIGR03790 family)